MTDVLYDKLVYGRELTREQWRKIKYRPFSDSDMYAIIEDPSFGIDKSEIGPVIPTDRILYRALARPKSTWITENCSENVFDDTTRTGYLVLNKDVTILETDEYSNIFNDNGYDENISSIDIPEQIIKIGNNAFKYCYDLSSITLPNTITSIGDNAFRNCHIRNLYFPESIVKIGDNAFYNVSPDTLICPSTNMIELGENSFGEDEDSIMLCFVPSECLSDYENNEDWQRYVYQFVSIEDMNKMIIYSADEKIESSWIEENCASNEFDNNMSIGYLTLKDDINEISGNLEDKLNIFDNNVSYLYNLIIPNQITSIKDYAFSGISVDNIILPDSLKFIGNYTFYEFEVGSINIPNLVESIGSYAFYNSYLYNINISGKDTILNENSFEDCTIDSSIILPTNLTNIPNNCFKGSSIELIVFPESLKTIGKFAFEECELNNINLPSNLTSIGDNAFENSYIYYLSSDAIVPPTLGNNVFDGLEGTSTCIVPKSSVNSYQNNQKWSEYFNFAAKEDYNRLYYIASSKPSSYWIDEHCSKNVFDESTGEGYLELNPNTYDTWEIFGTNNSTISYVKLPLQITEISQNSFKNYTALTSITIPDSVIEIGNEAFNGCTSLTSITIPDSVTSLGYSVFATCTSLTSVSIGSNITNLSSGTFSDCYNLSNISVSSNNSTYDSRNNCNAIIETSTNALIYGCKNTIIPDSVTEIREYAFYYCTGLTEITIPDSVTTIGGNAFEYCSNLTEVTIGNSVINSSHRIFYGCDSLTNVTLKSCPDYIFDDVSSINNVNITDSVTTIGEFAFYGCTGLTEITIPESITTIGLRAFNHCTGLTTVNFNAINCTSMEYIYNHKVFYGCDSLTTLTIGENVTNIPNYAFFNCDKLSGILTIPNSVENIGSYAFSGCSGLTEITIPNSVENIGSYAFASCTGIENILSFGSISQLSDNVFYNCTGLTSVIIPNSVTSIGSKAFSSCSGLITITIPNSVTTIGNNAFEYCSNLTEVTIGNSVTTIGKHAFVRCTELINVNFNATQCTSMGTSGSPVFEYCTNLTSLKIGENVISIPIYAFYRCYALKSIIFPDSVTTISNYAFQSCTSLEQVTFGNSIDSISNWAFVDCPAITSVTCHKVIPPTLGSSNFTSSNDTLYVPADSVQAYLDDTNWNDAFNGNIQAITE